MVWANPWTARAVCRDTTDEVNIYQPTENPLTRPPIKKSLDLGVKCINGLLTAGMGQRVGIMAGSGVGKSVLLGMIARATTADVNVIALIGERGREVREFIENDLGPEGLKRSVIVCATSDQSPVVRMRGAFVATAISEYFCAQGRTKRSSDDGLRHTFFDGSTRNRLEHRRTAGDERVYTERF